MKRELPIGTEWEVFPHFVLRRAGFSFDWLATLALDQAATDLLTAVEASMALDQWIADWNQCVFPPLLAAIKAHGVPEKKKALERVARAVRRGMCPAQEDVVALLFPLIQPLPCLREGVVNNGAHPASLERWFAHYIAILNQRATTETTFKTTFATDLQQCRTALRTRSEHPSFREAVFLLDGPIKQGKLQTDVARTSTVRQREQLLFKYLQRFCAKNETNSFFGPVHYGQIVQSDQALSMPPSWDDQTVERTVFFSHWVVGEIAHAISADHRLRDVLPVRSVPTRRRHAELAWEDTGLSIREWAKQWQVDLEEARSTVDRAIDTGIWQRCLNIAPAEVHQMHALLTQVKHLPAETLPEQQAKTEWCAMLEAFVGTGERFVRARTLKEKQACREDIEQRFQTLHGSAVKRNAGRMFRTRGVVYEDGWVAAPAQLSDTACRDLVESLSPVLNIAVHYTRLCLAKLRTECIAVARAWFGTAACISYDRFIAAWHAQSQHARPIDPMHAERIHALEARLSAFDTLWTDTLTRLSNGAASDWPMEPFSALTADLPSEHFAIVSPDILPMTKEDGSVGWVLGEIHHGITMNGWMLSFHPEWQAIKAGIDEALRLKGTLAGAGQTYLPANLIMARQMKTAPQEYPGVTVEFSARSDAPDGASMCHLKDLQVRLDDTSTSMELVEPERGIPLRFFPPAFGFDPVGYAPFEVFSQPILRLPKRSTTAPLPSRQGTGIESLPRCSYRNLVIARAEWRIESPHLAALAEVCDLADLMLRANKIRVAFSFPQHTFLRCASEPKPIYIDWMCPFGMEFLAQIVRRGDTLIFSEMLPEHDALWLRGKTGAYTSEFRFMMTRNA